MLITREGQVKVIDFGLSHPYERDAHGDWDRSTPLKRLVGSKSYVAPEVSAATRTARVSSQGAPQRPRAPTRGSAGGALTGGALAPPLTHSLTRTAQLDTLWVR